MKTAAFFFMALVMTIASAQQKPRTGYAPVNGLRMYYEVHGPARPGDVGDKPGLGNSRAPVVLLHGSFMAIPNNWTTSWGAGGGNWIKALAKTRKVIAIELQGHGRTADIARDITDENMADDVAALLGYLKIPKADLIGYSMGGSVAMHCAIRHPDKVRKAVIISAMLRPDGAVPEGVEALKGLTPEVFKGSPLDTDYRKLSPTPNDFPKLVKRLMDAYLKGKGIGNEQLKANRTPMFFIHGDSDGVRLEHVAEMFRLKGGGIHGDIKPLPASRLAILPATTHVTLMNRMNVIIPLINDFLNAK